MSDIESSARRKKDQAEWGLSHWVDAFLDRVLLGDCWYTAIEGGTWLKDASPQQRQNAEERRKARGIKPAHLDWYAYQRSTGIYAQWELKVNGNPTRKGQDDTIAALERNKIPTAVCETVPEVWAFLRDAGFALHGNADNIARELHEKYLAERRKAASQTPARKSRSSRAPARKGAVTVKQAHRLGFWK